MPNRKEPPTAPVMADHQRRLQQQLFDVCQNGSVENLRQLLAQPHFAAMLLDIDPVVDEDLRPMRNIVLYKRESNLHRMMIMACLAEDPGKLELLLSTGLDLNVSVESMVNRDLVHEAMKSDSNVALFEKLMTVMPGVVNLNMSLAGSPLSYAVGGHLRECQSLPHKGTIGLARLLLENGADPNRIQRPHFETSGYYLFQACERADIEIVRLLIQHGAQTNVVGPAQAAAARGRIDVLDLLLQQGVDLHSSFEGTSCMGKRRDGSLKEVATRYEQQEVLRWLAKNGVS